jgi:hypothetical protein
MYAPKRPKGGNVGSGWKGNKTHSFVMPEGKSYESTVVRFELNPKRQDFWSNCALFGLETGT